MNRLISSALLVSVLCLPSAVVAASASERPAPKPTQVFILAGQSNMAGAGRAKEVPADVAKAAREKVLVLRKGTWQPLRPWQRFGPEMTFGIAMAEARPGERIGLIKVAAGGSSLNDWKPKAKSWSKRRPNFYTQLIDAVTATRADTSAVIVGMLWMQGEAEARYNPKGYFEKLKEFITRVRKDTGCETLPFAFGRINPDEKKYKGVKAVREAQERVAREISNTAMVDCDGLAKRADNVHYDSKGQLELGKRFAAAMLKLVDEQGASRTTSRPAE